MAAIKSELGLSRGQWKTLCQLLELPTTFEVALLLDFHSLAVVAKIA
jgi:hypothetical protein